MSRLTHNHNNNNTLYYYDLNTMEILGVYNLPDVTFSTPTTSYYIDGASWWWGGTYNLHLYIHKNLHFYINTNAYNI